MKSDYTEQELSDQLGKDLKEGESWHIEFKAYTHEGLSSHSSEWKDDLAREMAALASIGGRIYIGVTNDGRVSGIAGSHQDWQELLIERASGNIKPKIVWKSYYFPNPDGLSLVRVELQQVEPIYFFRRVPYIREGTQSRPAEPEEVKERYKDYFQRFEPSVLKGSDKSKDPNHEQSQVIGWILETTINLLTYQNLFAEKEANPQLRTLRFALDAVRRNINENLGRVKRVLGPDSRYYELVESIEKHLSEGMSVTLLIDGGISWNRWLEEIGNAHDQAEELLSYIKSETNVRVSDLADQKADFKDKLIRWLDSIGNELTKFIYEASSYVHQSLRIHYLIQASGDEGAGVYKELADRLERLSWARTNVDYQEIEAAIPGIRAIVVGLP